MVITGRARSSIRRFTRNQQRKQFVQLGKAILHKISQKNNHILSEKLFEEYLNDFECEDLKDLYASVGEGLLLGEDVIRHVFVDTQKDGELLQNIAKKQVLEKVYDPAALEGKISGLLESSGGTGCRVASSKPPFSVLMPPPNVTGLYTWGML